MKVAECKIKRVGPLSGLVWPEVPQSTSKYPEVPQSTSSIEQFRAVWDRLEQFGTVYSSLEHSELYICVMGLYGLLSLTKQPIRVTAERC